MALWGLEEGREDEEEGTRVRRNEGEGRRRQGGREGGRGERGGKEEGGVREGGRREEERKRVPFQIQDECFKKQRE